MNTTSYHHVMPKTLSYLSDGSGRDTYISIDNGGYFYASLKTPGVKRGLNRPQTSCSRIQPKSLHYTADGTGRDGYVVIADGGLHGYTTQGNAATAFQKSLRDYSKQVQFDRCTKTQSAWGWDRRSKTLLRQKALIVRNTIQRLHYSKK